MTTPQPDNDASAARSSYADTTVSTKRPWSTWPDWVNVIFGVYLILAPIWTEAAPIGWFLTLGILIAVVGLWALATVSSAASEWAQIVLGVITFLAPWIGGFAAVTGAAWTAWIIGVLVILFAAIGMAQGRKAQPTAYTR